MQRAPAQILIVTSRADEGNVLHKALVDAGPGEFAPARCPSLAGAEELSERTTFDAILLDLDLPDARPRDAVARAQRAAPRTPLVLLATVDHAGAAAEMAEKGAFDYLVKE